MFEFEVEHLSQSRSRDFIVLRITPNPTKKHFGSQSRSRDFIVLRNWVGVSGDSACVTIPFAGFYCSEKI